MPFESTPTTSGTTATSSPPPDLSPSHDQGSSLRHIPLHRTARRLLRQPLQTIEEIAQQSKGDIVRLDLGVFRPYLVLRPDQVQRVLRDNATNYVREGMLWKAIRRLVGNGILSEGAGWATSRRIMNPLFSAKHVESLFGQMAEAITEAVTQLDPRARSGPIDSSAEMTRIVHRAVIRVFFGDRISLDDADRLAPAVETAATSITPRLIMPFAPDWLPMPGDRAFARATRLIDDVMLPVVRAARDGADTSADIVSTLVRATDSDGNGLTDRQIRDDVVSMFAAGTETTAVALTWLWVVLDDYPDVARRLCAEIDEVVGEGPVTLAHLSALPYTKMVIQELLRLYSVGWLVPRTAAHDDEIAGVPIKRGETVIISPYLTQRMDWLWDSPLVFDPERFRQQRSAGRHRYAYFPFGGGAHQCIGSHFFLAEAQLIIASLLSRYRPTLCTTKPVVPQVSASLRPQQRVMLRLEPLNR